MPYGTVTAGRALALRCGPRREARPGVGWHLVHLYNMSVSGESERSRLRAFGVWCRFLGEKITTVLPVLLYLYGLTYLLDTYCILSASPTPRTTCLLLYFYSPVSEFCLICEQVCNRKSTPLSHHYTLCGLWSRPRLRTVKTHVDVHAGCGGVACVCVRARVCVLCVRVCVIHDDMNCDRPTNMRKK